MWPKFGSFSGPTPEQAMHLQEQARRAVADREEQIARDSQAALDALPAGREKQMVIAIDELLSNNLGSADGYLGRCGLPATRKLQAALATYGITPDYGASIGQPRRRTYA